MNSIHMDGGEYQAAAYRPVPSYARPLIQQSGQMMGARTPPQQCWSETGYGEQPSVPWQQSGMMYMNAPPYNPEAVLREQMPMDANLMDPSEEGLQPSGHAKGSIFVLLSLGGLAAVSLYSIIAGRISVLSHPLNYRGLACGWDAPVRHLPFVYYPIDPKDGKQATLMSRRPMCVQRCPDEADVAKKAYISISDASAVSIGKSLALLSVLHSVRSPVYSSAVDYSSFCIPEAPALRSQFDTILSGLQTTHSSTLRSIASTVISGLPSSLLASILAAAGSHIAIKTYIPQNLIGSNGIPIAAVIIIVAGLNALLRYSQWTSGALCVLAGAGLLVSGVFSNEATQTGAKIIQAMTPTLELMPRVTNILMGIHIIGLSIVYFTLLGFTFLQTSKAADEGTPLDFSLDPNGGLKFFPLEMISTERNNDWIATVIKSAVVLLCGVGLLEYLKSFYNTIVIFMTLRTFQNYADEHVNANSLEDTSGLAMSRTFDCLGVIAEDCAAKVIAKLLLPFAVLFKCRDHPFFSERLTCLDNDGAIIQYCLENMASTADTVYLISYSRSAEEARALLDRNEDYADAMDETMCATWGPSYSLNACIFSLTFTIFLFVNWLGGISVTSKAPLLASLMVTGLFSFIADMGICSAATSVNALLYSSARSTEQCQPINDETLKAVRYAMTERLSGVAH